MSYPTDRQYTKDHEWVRVVNGVAVVGITTFAQDQLGDVIFVDLPDVGHTITAGEAFGSIESVKSVSELFAPVTGEVVDVNDTLTARPEAVNTAPHETWMIKVRLSGGGTPTALLNAGEYEALIAS